DQDQQQDQVEPGRLGQVALAVLQDRLQGRIAGSVQWNIAAGDRSQVIDTDALEITLGAGIDVVGKSDRLLDLARCRRRGRSAAALRRRGWVGARQYELVNARQTGLVEAEPDTRLVVVPGPNQLLGWVHHEGV